MYMICSITSNTYTVNNKYVKKVAEVASVITAVDPTIVSVERFIKGYRDVSSHHRNALGPKNKDNILMWKWNMASLKQLGYEC